MFHVFSRFCERNVKRVRIVATGAEQVNGTCWHPQTASLHIKFVILSEAKDLLSVCVISRGGCDNELGELMDPGVGRPECFEEKQVPLAGSGQALRFAQDDNVNKAILRMTKQA